MRYTTAIAMLTQKNKIMTNIEHYGAERVFRAIEEGKEVGRIEYELSGQVMTITHTYAYIEGRGVGRLLADAAIDYARGHGMKIIPLCSYVRLVMERAEEYHNLLYKG